MGKYEELKISGFDHLEFAIGDLEATRDLYFRFGFECVGTRELRERRLKSYVMAQNGIYIVLSQSAEPRDPVAQYVQKHGDGVFSVGLRCENAVSALEIVANRGAKIAEAPRAFRREAGEVEQAAIHALGDVRHTFISRKGNLFAEGFDSPLEISPQGHGLGEIDHVTNNVEAGKMEEWAEFYEKVFGFQNTRFFDIHTERTGLYSKVMESPDGKIKMPINEPTEAQSQIQEFIDVHHGPGVQHVALTTSGIIDTVQSLRKMNFKFLQVPHTYYEAIPGRVPNVQENIDQLEATGILVDGDKAGYLLQIFSQTLIGPFFYEVIQRKGNKGFGEGNFKALFEAMERDQIARGVLKP